ncbi:hypothetical protein ALI144C_27250 [Actinosynnema sp. ALI-1.44]|uniref:hypothetical protein n=1 Tax=Actinosynnema sp. ALI-1.44 TaxID=1933779 RepID=UPI00097C241B|nr:hypothetical protein [Actinosynnema sp. ALI-1.44]ONI79494.1 hypothetical protein ALI144C_27250 [Actinosynnema sp. ALI-1.44]
MLRALLVSTLETDDGLKVLAREANVLRTELHALRGYLETLSAEAETDPMVLLGLSLRTHFLEGMLKWTTDAARQFRAASAARG